MSCLSWACTVATDLDVFAISPHGADHGPGSPDDTSTGAGEEDLTLTDPIDGVWHVRSVAATTPVPTAGHAVITLTTAPRPTVPPPPPPSRGGATFVNYRAPENIPPATGSTSAGQHGAGEPSIGVNWNTGKTFIQAGNHTLRVTFNDAVKPAGATWEDKRSPFARASLDPILFTDDGHFGGTDRTFESQLLGATSATSFTDDDANTWLLESGSGEPAGVDHQTVGGGNYAAPAPPHTYPHAIYYCSQSIAVAFCSRSDDGGLTYGPGIPLYAVASVNGVDVPKAPGTCGGLHGHVRVSPDGTAYVPNKNCQDAGKARPGLHWTKSKDAGTPFGIQNTEFAEVMAGDDDRASFAFLGTQAAGDPQSPDFPGVWHLYKLHLRQRPHLAQQPLPQPARLQRHHRRQDRPRPDRIRRRLYRKLRA